MTDAYLVADQVNFGYTSRGPLVVENWSATFPAGSVSAITGPSGCGKSTRIYLLALMLKLRAGAVVLDGQRVDNLSDSERAKIRARRFGFVFQDAALDPTRTVMANVLETALYRSIDPSTLKVRAIALLTTMGVDVPPERLPGQISGGQAQRIALCRALVGSPTVIFADEPTGNLDPGTADIVLAMLREQADQGAVVIVITHDQRVAAWSDSQHILKIKKSGE